VGNNFVRSGGNDESGASGLSERTEKIGSHTGNISYVITDVIGNGTWVSDIIFFKILDGLTDEIGTNISSFSVDTSTDSTEESDGRTTETVSGNEFEHSSGEDADSLFEFVVFSVVGLHAAELILVGPGPGSSGEVVVVSPSVDLLWIWEMVIENLTSSKFLITDEIIARWLMPSDSGVSGGLCGTFSTKCGNVGIGSLVVVHGILPGVWSTSTSVEFIFVSSNTTVCGISMLASWNFLPCTSRLFLLD
jgi:hypothetical protein